MLDAIFHEQCIICEGDADCKFYNTIADHEEADDKKKWADTLFVPSSGKSSIYKIARALKALGVPTKVIADIDILNSKAEIKRLVESLNGDWNLYEPSWVELDNFVRNDVPTLTEGGIKKEIIELLKKSTGLPKSDVVSLMQQKNPWAIVKKKGFKALPEGRAQEAFKELTLNLNSIGLFILDVGEIEGFLPDFNSHGPKAIYRALEKYKLNGPELKEASQFVSMVCKAEI